MRDDRPRHADEFYGSLGEIGEHEPPALRGGRAGALDCSPPGPKQSELKEDMMRAAVRTSSVRGIRENRTGHWLGRAIFAVVLAEFRRAVAAARRYENLRYGSGRQERMAPGEISRRVFEEFYSSARPVESRRAERALQVDWRRSAGREADQGEAVNS
jgi:hypothetical protein